MKYLLAILFFFTIKLNAQTTIHSAFKDVTDVIVHDVFSAPAAARIYAYTAIAAYEAMEQGYAQYSTFHGKLNEMPVMQMPEKANEIDFDAAGILACYFTAQHFIYSERILNEKIEMLINNYDYTKNIKDLNQTIVYAKSISESIIKWSQSDNYDATRLKTRYTLINEPFAWQPTGPDYENAVEPYWGELRTFVIDETTINNILPAPTFSTDTNSLFYKEALEVYSTINNLTAEQKAIADFWDDNPYSIAYVGHLQLGKKKISPAGHWLSIARTVMQNQEISSIKAAYIYALASLSMADAFIACWHIKYATNIVRPETYIKKYINPAWQPYIITPAFPEYSSGHSTISAACATILTYCIGDNLVFTDSILTAYGFAPRAFNSFNAAANEASVSRLYAGIHFHAALYNGATQGNAIGIFILGKIGG